LQNPNGYSKERGEEGILSRIERGRFSHDVTQRQERIYPPVACPSPFMQVKKNRNGLRSLFSLSPFWSVNGCFFSPEHTHTAQNTKERTDLLHIFNNAYFFRNLGERFPVRKSAAEPDDAPR